MHDNTDPDATDCLGIRVDLETIQLSTGDGAIDLHYPNEVEHFPKVEELVQTMKISLVTVIANGGLERPLVEWLQEKNVPTVVLELTEGQPSIINQIGSVAERHDHAKLFLAGLAGIFGGVSVVALGLQADQNGIQIVPGGIWKGSLIIVLGFGLIAMTYRKSNRETNSPG